MEPLAKKAIDVVKDGRIKFVPERFTKTYLNWMENVHDWCISRQLWWGHQIPAWYCADCGHITVSREDATECECCHSKHITRDEDVLDNLHSVYVDQWDWEKVIEEKDRTIDYLKSTVMDIVSAVCDTQDTMQAIYPQLKVLPKLQRQVTFVTTQELEDRYPELTPKQRETAFVKEHPTTFIIGIGGALKSGQKHDGRSPDYDDWTLNGDILFWNDLLGCAFELSSMGIRVDPESLDRQLTIAGCDDRRSRTYHKMLLSGELPLTIGGGIGQSRLSMLLLGKAHIGEVQASVWDDETISACEAAGVMLL